MLVNVVRDAKNITYFDPLGNPIPEKLDTVLKSKNCFPDFVVMDLQWKLEKDSDHCGTWVIGYVRKRIAGVDIREKGQFDITAERRVHNQILSEASSSHPSIASLSIDSSTREDSPDVILTPSPDVPIDHAGQNANFNTHSPFGFFGSTAEDRNRSSSTPPREDCEDRFKKII